MKRTLAIAVTAVLGSLAAAHLRAQAPPAEQHPDPLAGSLFPPELVIEFGADVGLAEEERAAVRAEVEKAQPRFEDLHRRLQKETEGLAGLLKKERVDPAAALAQLDKVADLEREIKRAQLALIIGIKNRLTPEQQAKL